MDVYIIKQDIKTSTTNSRSNISFVYENISATEVLLNRISKLEKVMTLEDTMVSLKVQCVICKYIKLRIGAHSFI